MANSPDRMTRLELDWFQVVLHTAEYRGDHAASVSRILTVQPGETVEHLARRAFPDTDWKYPPRNPDPSYDRIEIKPAFREVVKPEGK